MFHPFLKTSLDIFQLFSVYIPVDASQGEDQVTLFSMVGTNFVSPTPINVEGLYGIVINYIWKIKVTQIDCGFNNPLRGMYFTANTYFWKRINQYYHLSSEFLRNFSETDDSITRYIFKRFTAFSQLHENVQTIRHWYQVVN